VQSYKPFRERTWFQKFRDAFRGVKEGIRGQASFFVQFFVAALVVVAAAVLKIDSLQEWCLLLMCITIVLAAEMFNSALEALARAVTDQENPYVRDSLDVGSAAVLLASIGSTVIGGLIFGNRLVLMLGWW